MKQTVDQFQPGDIVKRNRGLPAVLHTLGQLCGNNPRKAERW